MIKALKIPLLILVGLFGSLLVGSSSTATVGNGDEVENANQTSECDDRVEAVDDFDTLVNVKGFFKNINFLPEWKTSAVTPIEEAKQLLSMCLHREVKGYMRGISVNRAFEADGNGYGNSDESLILPCLKVVNSLSPLSKGEKREFWESLGAKEFTRKELSMVYLHPICVEAMGRCADELTGAELAALMKKSKLLLISNFQILENARDFSQWRPEQVEELFGSGLSVYINLHNLPNLLATLSSESLLRLLQLLNWNLEPMEISALVSARRGGLKGLMEESLISRHPNFWLLARQMHESQFVTSFEREFRENWLLNASNKADGLLEALRNEKPKSNKKGKGKKKQSHASSAPVASRLTTEDELIGILAHFMEQEYQMHMNFHYFELAIQSQPQQLQMHLDLALANFQHALAERKRLMEAVEASGHHEEVLKKYLHQLPLSSFLRKSLMAYHQRIKTESTEQISQALGQLIEARSFETAQSIEAQMPTPPVLFNLNVWTALWNHLIPNLSADGASIVIETTETEDFSEESLKQAILEWLDVTKEVGQFSYGPEFRTLLQLVLSGAVSEPTPEFLDFILQHCVVGRMLVLSPFTGMILFSLWGQHSWVQEKLAKTSGQFRLSGTEVILETSLEFSLIWRIVKSLDEAVENDLNISALQDEKSPELAQICTNFWVNREIFFNYANSMIRQLSPEYYVGCVLPWMLSTAPLRKLIARHSRVMLTEKHVKILLESESGRSLLRDNSPALLHSLPSYSQFTAHDFEDLGIKIENCSNGWGTISHEILVKHTRQVGGYLSDPTSWLGALAKNNVQTLKSPEIKPYIWDLIRFDFFVEEPASIALVSTAFEGPLMVLPPSGISATNMKQVLREFIWALARWMVNCELFYREALVVWSANQEKMKISRIYDALLATELEYRQSIAEKCDGLLALQTEEEGGSSLKFEFNRLQVLRGILLQLPLSQDRLAFINQKGVIGAGNLIYLFKGRKFIKDPNELSKRTNLYCSHMEKIVGELTPNDQVRDLWLFRLKLVSLIPCRIGNLFQETTVSRGYLRDCLYTGKLPAYDRALLLRTFTRLGIDLTNEDAGRIDEVLDEGNETPYQPDPLVMVNLAAADGAITMGAYN